LERAAEDPAARAAVDSGRLAEPFWYVDSPLTTPDPARPFAGRPPRGTTPPPAPGIIVPDAPLTVDGRPTTLRRIARDGLLLIADAPIPDIAARLPMTGELREALGAHVCVGPESKRRPRVRRAGSARLRPDPGTVTRALRRCLGIATKEDDHGLLPAAR
jgi:3-(3-hydroxy-phenyl)propionate hydroxylase